MDEKKFECPCGDVCVTIEEGLAQFNYCPLCGAPVDNESEREIVDIDEDWDSGSLDFFDNK